MELTSDLHDPRLVSVGTTQIKPDEWTAFLFTRGRIVPLFPTFLKEICGSRDEVVERVRIKLSLDPEARKRWAGSHIVPVNFGERVSIRPDGSLR